jgi:hypothetical protein
LREAELFAAMAQTCLDVDIHAGKIAFAGVGRASLML